jgi:hypothetical protein
VPCSLYGIVHGSVNINESVNINKSVRNVVLDRIRAAVMENILKIEFWVVLCF